MKLLYSPIPISICLGVLVGFFLPTNNEMIMLPFTIVSSVFLGALKLVVVPLVCSSIILGIIELTETKSASLLSKRIIIFYVFSTTIASTIGIMISSLIKPGSRIPQNSHTIPEASNTWLENLQQISLVEKISELLNTLIPTNLFAALSSNNLLTLLILSTIFGLLIPKLPDNSKTTLIQFFKGILDLMVAFTQLIIKTVPLCIFAILVKTTNGIDLSIFTAISWFFFSVVLALSIHMFVIMPLILSFFGVNPWKHFIAIKEALLVAFSTASSLATLPITTHCLEKNAKLSPKITKIVLPLGATLNMDGTALYECAVVLFIAQMLGIDLTLLQQFLLVGFAIISSIGVAGIPSGSLVVIVFILELFKLPPELLGLILISDRILDMCRTTVNVFGDTCCAQVIAASTQKTTTQKNFRKYYLVYFKRL